MVRVVELLTFCEYFQNLLHLKYFQIIQQRTKSNPKSVIFCLPNPHQQLMIFDLNSFSWYSRNYSQILSTWSIWKLLTPTWSLRIHNFVPSYSFIASNCNLLFFPSAQNQIKFTSQVYFGSVPLPGLESTKNDLTCPSTGRTFLHTF